MAHNLNAFAQNKDQIHNPYEYALNYWGIDLNQCSPFLVSVISAFIENGASAAMMQLLHNEQLRQASIDSEYNEEV